MSADKDARIAELEREISELKNIRVSDAIAGQCAIEEANNLIVELKRKLAEQQVAIEGVLSYLNRMAARSIRPDLYMRAQRDSLMRQGTEELNNLLAKTKEEGRKEAVPEGWQVVPIEPTEEMMNAAEVHYSSAEYTGLNSTYRAMVLAAPKPQGEISCQ